MIFFMGHASLERLGQQVKDAQKKIEVGATFSHYKTPDQKYRVEFIGVLEKSEEICVGYRALYGEGILWVRALSDFTEKINTERGVVNRFQKENT